MEERPRLDKEKLVCANCLVKMRFELRDQDLPELLLRCEGCELLHYCSAVCQTEHWEANHKYLCKIFSRKEILETKHIEGFCHTCSWESKFNTKTSIVLTLWELFGYIDDDSDYIKIRKKEEVYPWQCPYLLGECTGEYVGWVDEYLAKIDELLTMTMVIYGGKINSTVQLNYTNLRTEFLDLRAWYWYFSSVMKKESSAMADVHIARLAFWMINNRRVTKEFPFVVLNDHFQIDAENHPPLWESLLDFVSRFYKRLRMAKYSMINLGEIL